MDDREQSICLRVREIREREVCSQAALAKAVGVGRDQLASVEYGRTPLRHELGKQLCYQFGVNQRWLATGQGPWRPYFDISPHQEHSISPRALFSAAYDKVLKDIVEGRWADIERVCGPDAARTGNFEDCALDSFPLAGDPEPKAAAFYAKKFTQTRLELLEGELLKEYANALLSADEEFCYQHARQLQIKSKGKKTVDAVTARRNDRGMKSEMQSLLRRLKAVTAQRGQKAKLAFRLRVPMPRISEWLSGKVEPSGETALRLLEWVQSEETRGKR